MKKAYRVTQCVVTELHYYVSAEDELEAIRKVVDDDLNEEEREPKFPAGEPLAANDLGIGFEELQPIAEKLGKVDLLKQLINRDDFIESIGGVDLISD